MVFVKVRETYDLCTVKDKMTVISIHTPKPDIIKRSYPGLLMQCKAYRPYSCNVKLACASMQSLDPLQVGTDVGDIAPEDAFNPILYKAMTNFGMSQLEARIAAMDISGGTPDVQGSTSSIDVDSNTTLTDEFNLYYGLLSDTNGWKHAAPQAGLTMMDLKPLVWEMVYNIGDNAVNHDTADPMSDYFQAPDRSGYKANVAVQSIRGGAKPMPFINTTAYTLTATKAANYAAPGFPMANDTPSNCEIDVPWIKVCVAGLVIPPSKLHSLYYRMIVEWVLEFSQIRALHEITDWNGLAAIGSATHYKNYDYTNVKEALTGSTDSCLDHDSCMVSANVDVNKVM